MTKAYGNISKGRKTTMSEGEKAMRLQRMKAEPKNVRIYSRREAQHLAKVARDMLDEIEPQFHDGSGYLDQLAFANNLLRDMDADRRDRITVRW